MTLRFLKNTETFSRFVYLIHIIRIILQEHTLCYVLWGHHTIRHMMSIPPVTHNTSFGHLVMVVSTKFLYCKLLFYLCNQYVISGELF